MSTLRIDVFEADHPDANDVGCLHLGGFSVPCVPRVGERLRIDDWFNGQVCRVEYCLQSPGALHEFRVFVQNGRSRTSGKQIECQEQAATQN